MNTTRFYWDMLIKNPSECSDGHKNIFQNVQDDKIIGFNKKNGTDFLSNFYPSTIKYQGFFYQTVEHAYQASKTVDEKSREIIRKSKNPMDAKKLGRALVLRDDWDDVKISIMKELIEEKFQNPFLMYMLIDTCDYQLINENRWNDRFWGMTNGIGENWLGKILEEVRQKIKDTQ